MCGSNPTRRRRRLKRKRSSTAGAAVNDDLMISILSRLPTKSLFRFGCASKSWSRLISDVWSRRRERLLLPISGFCFKPCGYRPSNRIHYTPISAMEDEIDYCKKAFIISHLPSFSDTIMDLIYSSCNGLLLFMRSYSILQNPHVLVLSLSVINPATSELVALPTAPPIRGYPDTYLAFDPHKSPHYKVACFFTDDISSGVVNVYSSISAKWIQRTFRDQGGRFPGHSAAAFVFHDDVLHMIDRRKVYLARFHLKIDDEGGDFLEPIPLPDPDDFRPAHQSSLCIGKSRGRLCLAMNTAQQSNNLKIWMLKTKAVDQYYWSLTHTLCTNVVYTNPQPERCIVNPVAFHPGSAIVYVSEPGKLLECNLSSGTSKVIYHFTEDANAMITNDIFPVFPCLESIDPPGGKYIHADRFLPSSTSENKRPKFVATRKANADDCHSERLHRVQVLRAGVEIG